MSIFAEMSAVQSRIAAIIGAHDDVVPTVASTPPSNVASIVDGPPVPGSFNAWMHHTVAASPQSSPSAPPPLYAPYVQAAAGKYGVDPLLIHAIITQESGYQPQVVSAAGAQGMMQLMPATSAALGVSDPFDPAQNIDGGTRYLRGLYDRLGDWRLAVAAYNAGPEAVMKCHGVPPYRETQQYVANVFHTVGFP